MLKAVIFDYDGILADGEHVQKEKWDNILKPYNIIITEEDYAENFSGKSSSSVIPAYLKERYPQLPMTIEELAQAAADELKRIMPHRTIERIPGVLEALEFFKVQSYKMAVCSGKTPADTALKLERIELQEWFPAKYRVAQSDVNFKGKPAPDMYQLALTRLGLNADEAVVFEDTAAGIHAAKTAGIKAIAIPSRYSKKHNFAEADFVFVNGWPEVLQNWDKVLALFA